VFKNLTQRAFFHSAFYHSIPSFSFLIRKMVVAKQFVDVATNTLAQHILLEFVRSGLLEKRIKRRL